MEHAMKCANLNVGGMAHREEDEEEEEEAEEEESDSVFGEKEFGTSTITE